MDQGHDSWPDAAQPGMPVRPERDGCHVIVLHHQADSPEVAKWSAEGREWLLPGAVLPKSMEWAAKFCAYVSPVRINAELRAAYEHGVADGRAAALAGIEDIKRVAVHEALRDRDRDVAAARREGAAWMRERAAGIVMATDTSRPAEHLGTWRDKGGMEQWHWRLYAAAVRELRLPDET